MHLPIPPPLGEVARSMPCTSTWRVAVPLDGSRSAQRAVRHVVNLAKRESRLEVVLVGLEPRLAGAVPAPLARLLVPARATAAGRTRDARVLLEMHRIPYRATGAAGDPAGAIADAVRSHDCDEVVLGPADGRTAGDELAREIAARSGRRVTVVD